MDKLLIRKKFLQLQTLTDVANLLKIKPAKLSYILYHFKKNRSEQYYSFEIPKRCGGTRTIHAPNSSLKHYQKQLSVVLNTIYWEKPSAHGFLNDKSIITNAHCHRKKRYVVNIDLKEFFPSIHFGRVMGLFQSKPYSLPREAAKVIAQIACTTHLPQGAPSSPIISNMICSKLDSQMQRFSKRTGCFYTRYADDITISSNHKKLPNNIGSIDKDQFTLSEALIEIIAGNGFEINYDKVRIQTHIQRQEVTGLTVNKFPNVSRKYIRNVRAILHNWEQKGIQEAAQKYTDQYSPKTKDKIKDKPSFFIKSIRGRIQYIHNIRRSSYELRYKPKKLEKSDISYKLIEKYNNLRLGTGSKTLIRTEGKTDWKHLLSAWEKLSSEYPNLDLEFHKFSNTHGESKLMSFCEKAKNLPTFHRPVVCIFDRDNKAYLSKHSESKFRKWKNNVFSFVLPEVQGYSRPSIEHYYPFDQLLTLSIAGRRLFFREEFDINTNTHTDHQNIRYLGNKKYDETNPKQIIDSQVFKDKKSVALSKDTFATKILQKSNNFAEVDFTNFRKIFNILNDITQEFTKTNSTKP